MKFLVLVVVAITMTVIAVKTFSSNKIDPEICQAHAELAETLVEARQVGISKELALAYSNDSIIVAIIEDVYNLPTSELNKSQAATQFAKDIYNSCIN